jgi:STE24 endopeptidase
MSRFLPLIIFVIWVSSPTLPSVDGIGPWVGCATFIGFYVAVVAVLALWSRHVAHAAHFSSIQRRLRRFNAVIYASRILIPAWLAAGVYLLGWKALVADGFARYFQLGLRIETPGLLIGCLPSFLTWMGLWWAQFPADRALREQNILIQLNEGLPMQPPPSFWTYFGVNLRLQLLFSLAPAIILLALHDVLTLALPPVFHRIPFLNGWEDAGEAMIALPMLAVLMIVSPEILRRVLHTEPLADCPLRRRMTEIAERHGVRFKDVLLWKTQHQMGNGAVMGLVPWFRYVLLSDLLLETMPDEQIEAIFAHEIGHVVHRHFLWLMGTVATIMFILTGPGQIVADGMESLHRSHVWLVESVQAVVLLGAGAGIFALVFGYVSRKFERQADVFAARVMRGAEEEGGDATNGDAPGVKLTPSPFVSQAVLEPAEATVSPAAAPVNRQAVNRYGAAVFCSALERVAAVNNIPIAARSWCHGSIAKRIRFLEFLARDGQRTAEFDGFMRKLYLTLGAGLIAFGIWTAVVVKLWT